MYNTRPNKSHDWIDSLDDISPCKTRDEIGKLPRYSDIERQMQELAGEPLVDRVVYLKDSVSAMQRVLKSLTSQADHKNLCQSTSSNAYLCNLSCNMMAHESPHMISVIAKWIAEKHREIDALKNLLPDHCKIESADVVVQRAAGASFCIFQLKVAPDSTIDSLIRWIGSDDPGSYWFYQVYTSPFDLQDEIRGQLQACLHAAGKGCAVFGICPSPLYPDGSIVKKDPYVKSNGNLTPNGSASSQLSPLLGRSPVSERKTCMTRRRFVSGQGSGDSLNVPSVHVSMNGNRSPTREPSPPKSPSQSCRKPSGEVVSVTGSELNSERGSSLIPDVYRRNCHVLKDGKPSICLLNRAKRCDSSLRWYQFGERTSSARHKVILLLGATGSGKSTLVDAMFNYALGVRWEDTIRFKIVPEEVHKSQAHSQTKYVTAYTLYHTEGLTVPYSLTVVDTPGFGDTEGLKRDEEITRTVSSFLIHPDYGINEINAVYFVASSADSRLTRSQKYVLAAVLSLFGNDVRPNIRLIATFSDGGTPPVVEACREAGFPLADDSGLVPFNKFNNSALFVSNCRSDEAQLDETYWSMAVKEFHRFFQSLEHLPPRSLERTKRIIQTRWKLENQAESFISKMEKHLSDIWDFLLKLQNVEKESRFKSQQQKKNEKQGYLSRAKSLVFNMEPMNLQMEKRKYSADIDSILIQMSLMLNEIALLSKEVESTGFLQTSPTTVEDLVTRLRNRLEKEKRKGYEHQIRILTETFERSMSGSLTTCSDLGIGN